MSAQDTVTQEWFSIRQVAQITGLSDDHIRRAVKAGKIPSSDVGNTDRPIYRIKKKDIEDFMSGNAVRVTPEAAAVPLLPLSSHFRARRA